MIRVVAGLLQRDTKILIAKRPDHKPYSGYWELPGGKIENNETSFAALQRELHEELGIIVQNAKSLLRHAHTYPDKSIDLELWQVDTFTGEPKSLEQQLLRWVTWDEIKQLKILAGNVALFEKLALLLQ